MLGRFKIRNAGQVCVSPTPLLRAEEGLRPLRRPLSAEGYGALKVGSGLEQETTHGTARACAPRRLRWSSSSRTRRSAAARSSTGGERRAGTAATSSRRPSSPALPDDARLMTERAVRPGRADRAVQRRRRGPQARELAAVRPVVLRLHRRPLATRAKVAERHLEAGMVNINHFGRRWPRRRSAASRTAASAAKAARRRSTATSSPSSSPRRTEAFLRGPSRPRAPRGSRR